MRSPMTNYSPEDSKSQPPEKASPGVEPSCRDERNGSDGSTPKEARSDSLLYLYCNNSIENTPIVSLKHPETVHRLQCIQALCGVLSPYYRKASETLHLNVKRLIELAPSTGHVGFLTLTFKDNVTDHDQAYKRFRSMNSNFLSKFPEFGEWICVKERQSRGSWHYHLVIHLGQDIKTGFNWDLYGKALELKDHSAPYLSPKNKEYRKTMTEALRTASPYLRRLWQTLREELPKYGFGRSELLPIRSNEDAMARYLGKYIGKHLGARKRSDKGVRLVNYSKKWVKNSVNFQWNTDGAKQWRKNLKMFATFHGCNGIYGLRAKFGTNWAYKYANEISSFHLTVEEDLRKIPF